MHCGVVTIFPEMLKALNCGVVGKALENQVLKLSTWNPRDFVEEQYKSVDDRPYGGGPGMIMKAKPLLSAVSAAKNEIGKDAKVIYLSPQGRLVKQRDIRDLADQSGVIFLAGRYEGVDERIVDLAVDQEWSLGDYVLSGGELAAMAMIDAVARLLPGVLGDDESNKQDSFSRDGLLDWPHYTRPASFNGADVPSVLLSGDHYKIQEWRLKQQLGRTWLRRPDLLEDANLSEQEKGLLEDFKREFGKRG